MARQIGILGGSFNPVHIGHLMLASYLSQYTSLDEVWLTFSPQNPLKNADMLIGDKHRIEMLRIASENVAGVEVCDAELNLPRPSYTIDTLTYLQERYPEYKFRLIIGADNWTIFNKWKEYERIIAEFGVIVYLRPGYELSEISVANVEVVEAPTINISSTFIREGFSLKKDMSVFLPHGVCRYILDNNLYQNNNI